MAVNNPYVAVTVPVPLEVGAMRSVVATPSASVVTVAVLMVPRVVVKVMDSPAIATPFASFRRTVILEVSVPFAKMAAGSAFMSLRETGLKVTVVESEYAPTVPVTVDVTKEALKEAVRVAVAMPSFVAALAVMVPAVALKFTTKPFPTSLPFSSLTSALIVALAAPFAYITSGSGVSSVMEETPKNLTVMALVTPLTEPVTVEVTVERLETDVRVAVATPAVVVLVAVMVPSVAEKVTTVPSATRLP